MKVQLRTELQYHESVKLAMQNAPKCRGCSKPVFVRHYSKVFLSLGDVFCSMRCMRAAEVAK